jgi:RNA polymerase sigma-70 factor (ECF subfamily)
MVSGFEAAVEDHQRRIYTFARYYLGNQEEADDITQEVLLRLWRNRNELDDEYLGAWLLRVTRNACYDLLRRRRSAAKVFSAESEDEVAETEPARQPGPQDRAEASSFRGHLRDALEELGEPYRSVIILREIQGLKYQEISDALEMPLTSVRVNLHRGRKKLRERLREVYDHAAA